MAPQEGWDGSAHAAVWVTAIGAMLGDIMAVIDRFWLRKRSKETDVEMGEGTSWFHDQLERHEELSDRFRQKERDWDKSFGEMRRSWARKIDELDRELRDLRAMKRQWAEMRAAVSRNGQGEVADAVSKHSGI